MNYLGLRWQIYRNELKQLIATISQLGKVFVFFFINVLIPGFMMLSLLGVSLIASKDTLISERIDYQTIYLILVYALIKVQAKAILATPYRHYINDLPITSSQHRRSNLGLTVVAGNVVLFAPLGLCLFIPDLKTLLETSFFILFAFMLLLISQTALYRRNIPLISVVIMPIVATYFYPSDASANGLNILWFMAVLAELLLLDKLKIPRGRIKITSYSALIMLFVKHRPINFITRILGPLVFVGSYSYIISKRPDFATENFHLFICFPIALLIGSYQFEIERFRAQYRYYLNDLPMSIVKQRSFELLPLLLLSAVPLLIYTLLITFTTWVIALQLALIVVTAAAVVRLGKHYYLAPSAVMLVLVIGLGFEGLGL